MPKLACRWRGGEALRELQSATLASLKFGVLYQRSRGLRNPRDFARRVEELGFDSFWMGESPTNRSPSWDTLAALCFAAAGTSRISIGSNVLLLPLHHPVWVAKQWGTLDHLSGGRAILCVGIGGEYPKQFEAFGVPISERGRRADEAIQVIRNLWTQPAASHTGPFFQFDGIVMEPKPATAPCPPIWVGGRPGGTETGPDGKPRYKSRTGAIQRAARVGDGWCPYYMTPETYRASVESVKRYSARMGRDVTHMTWGYQTHLWLRGSYQEALHEATARLRYGRNLAQRIGGYDILGNPREIMAKIHEFATAGVGHFILSVEAPPDHLENHLQRLADEVLPRCR